MTVHNHYKSKSTWILLAIVLIALFLVSGCSTIRTGAHYDESTNFGKYTRFSWIDEEPLITGQENTGLIISPLTQSKIKQAIRLGFERKGYEYVKNPENADFVVAYTIGTRSEVSTRSYPDAYSGNWGWHIRGGYYYINEVVVHDYTKGTLGVDVFDRELKKPVWHGFAEKTITTGDKIDPQSSIDVGVQKMLEHFPR